MIGEGLPPHERLAVPHRALLGRVLALGITGRWAFIST